LGEKAVADTAVTLSAGRRLFKCDRMDAQTGRRAMNSRQQARKIYELCAGSARRLTYGEVTAKRWQLIKAMAGQGPMTLREAARRVGRDVKAVHGDAHALLAAGILRRTPEGKLDFPFDAVHVDFLLQAVA
jgi:hypothetical protein